MDAQPAQRHWLLSHRRLVRRPAALLAGVVLVLALGAVSADAARGVLRAVAGYLVVDDPLRPAAAIVVLAGEAPGERVRTTAAAALYREGWAPRVILIGDDPEAPAGSSPTVSPSGRFASLLHGGVPADAIEIERSPARNTRDELRRAARLLQPGQPVLLVTSGYHTRRVQRHWADVAPGGAEGIVRAALDPAVDPGSWWKHPSQVRVVLHEYAGLLDAALGSRLQQGP